MPNFKFLHNMRCWILIIVLGLLLGSCNAMKKLQDEVFIQQRTPLDKPYPRVDSILIVANGNSATQRIVEDVLPLFSERLKKRGVASTTLFIPYSVQRINEAVFDNRKYTYTLWIYEQNKKMQQLENYDYLVPLAMKLTDNKTTDNVWIATSIYNNLVRKPYYREKYAGTLMFLFRANGMIQ